MTLYKYTYLVLFIAFFSLEGCAAMQSFKDSALPVNKSKPVTYQRPARIIPFSKEVSEAIEKRNSLTEKDPHWIDQAYKDIGISKINNIPVEKYSDYAKFVDNKAVYVIVHPAYYVFFHNKKPLIQRDPEDLESSIVDLFLGQDYDNPVIKVMQLQQKNEKEFIEHMTTENKLMILVLPKNYLNHKNYAYKSEMDEYARYINEVTNGSQAVLYIESDSATSGKLSINDLIVLLAFLSRTGAQDILIGGGYVGRCQEEFSGFMSNHSLAYNYFIIPEVSSFSPADLSEKIALNFLDNKKINLEAAAEFIVARADSDTNLQRVSLQPDPSIPDVSSQPEDPGEQIDPLFSILPAALIPENMPRPGKDFAVVITNAK